MEETKGKYLNPKADLTFKKISVSMKANGMTPEHIVKYTGLCMEEIINL